MRDAQPKSIYLKDYLPPLYVIDETHLKFDLYEDFTLVDSELFLRRNPDRINAEKGAEKLPLELVGQHLELLAVSVDDEELSSEQYSIDGDVLSLPEMPESFRLKIQTRIEPQKNTALEGLYKSGGMFCTQCEAEGFRRITYYLDRPDVMSVFTTEVIADKKTYPVLLSNGNAIVEKEFDNGRHSVTWHDPHKKPCYLFALVAGDLKVKEGEFTTASGREVELKIFVEPQNIDKTDYALDALKRSMTWDEETYGREYDLDIFMIVAVDDFNMGAMENKGLNIFNSSCVLANPQTATDAAYQRIEAIVAHEYFHNWSGNRVTCRDWFQLSLKEGFTVFRDAQFSADMNSATVKRIEDATMMRTVQFAEDASPMAHPVQPDSFMEISNFYTVTIYEKGAEVVGMIRKLLGADGFRKGSDLYFDRHDGQAVTINEFVSAMEDANQVSLGQFKRWYKQAGTPTVDVRSEYNKESQQYTLTFEQKYPDTPESKASEKAAYLIPFELGLIDEQGNDLPLLLAEAQTDVHLENGVLQLTEQVQSVTFEQIKSEPIPSLLRDFSAPVKLNYDYSRDQLLFLMQNDSDGFNRWDAGQTLALDVILEVMASQKNGDEAIVDSRLISAYKNLLQQGDIDHAMLAKMLLLPGVSYIAETQAVIDIVAIDHARSLVQKELANALVDELKSLYESLQSSEIYQPVPGQMDQRCLKNAALAYLIKADQDYSEVAQQQFRTSDNMTDGMAALSALVNSRHHDSATQALTAFYQQWKNEPLVVNQWLAVQSGSAEFGSAARITALLEHEAFDIKNPNKVRSVLGSFAGQSLVNFHAQDGSGYRLLAQNIIKLDALNPQIAARLVAPLGKWKRYVPAQGDLMKAELQTILAQNNLSKDVFEIVSKSLA